jgi:eukaryotic-like serine/threonine-protein kinase
MGYQVLGTLGQGARSTVYSVKDSKDQLYALKRVVKSKPEDQRFVDQAITEHEVCTKLDHPTIRKSYKLLYQRQFLRVKEIYVLMELVDGTPLEDIKLSSMMDVCKICQHIATGLVHMHKSGFVHADMKPRNVLITPRGQVKIIDFGQSCRSGTVKERIQGTIDFIAPEQVKREEITPRTDIYNFGATMYWLLTGRFVPSAYSKQVVSQETTSAVSKRAEEPFKPPREYNPSVPPALSMLVVDCVRENATDRPDSMQSVFERLNFAIMQVSADAKLVNGGALPRPKKGDSADADLSDIEAELDKLANQNRREQRPR